MKNLKKLLKIGILIFGISLITNCENSDNSILEESNIENVTDSIPSDMDIKFIQASELPNAFKEALFNNFPQQKNASSKQKQNLLESYFDPKASVIEAENGIITYALPIKNSKGFKSSLKKGTFQQKLSKSSTCDDEDPYEVLAMNFGDTNSGAAENNITHIAFTPGVAPSTTYITFTFPSTGTQETTSTTSNSSNTSSTSGSIGSIFASIWQGIKSVGLGIRNLFIGKDCHCPNYTGSKNSTQQKGQVDDSPEYDSCCDTNSSKNNDSNKGITNDSDRVSFQFYIPLPDSLFENSDTGSKNQSGKSTGNETNCECKLEKIDITTASVLIKQDLFDCACANDNAFNMSPLLELRQEQTTWLAQPENKTTREAICKFTKDNDYSEEAKAFDNLAVEALMDDGEVDFDDNVILSKKFKDNVKLKCVYDKLAGDNNNNTLFRDTVGAFIDNPNVNLILTTGDCEGVAAACTQTDYVKETGIITIMIEDIYDSPIEIAQLIIHEGIHAELAKYVLEHHSGIDTNDKPRLFELYKYYRESGVPELHIDHPYMALNYINPIASALRQFDNNKYPLDYYKSLAWIGLEKFDVNKVLDKPLINTYKQYKATVIQNSTTCN